MKYRQGFLLSSCTRCSGDLVLRLEDGDTTGTCLQCGNVLYMRRGALAPTSAPSGSPVAA